MKKLLTAAAAASLGMGLALTPTAAIADDHAASEMEKLDQTWFRIVHIKFKEGNRERIGEILEMYQKADKAAGVDGPVVIHMDTGKWNMVAYFRMKHGIEQMGWKTNPDGEKWWEAFKELAGGEEEARKLQDEWASYVADEVTHIGHRHPDEDEE